MRFVEAVVREFFELRIRPPGWLMARALGCTECPDALVNEGQLLDAIERVAAGQSLIDPALMARVLDRVRNGPQVAPELARLNELSTQALQAQALDQAVEGGQVEHYIYPAGHVAE